MMAPLIEEDLPSSRRASIDRNQSDRSPVENVLFNEERPLRGPSAPAVMFMTRLAAADQDLDSIFTSQDLVMLPRYAKTAPPIYAQSNSANISKYFPSMSWSARLQNSRLVDLLKFVQTTDSRGGRMTMSEETEISEAQIIQGLFESDIAEIYKLIDMAKSMVPSHFDDRRSLNSGFSLDSVKTKRSNALPPMSYNASAHAPTASTNGTKKKQIGRKSIRAIQEEVNQRMRILKSDPSEFNALEAKVRGYRNASIKESRVREEALKKDYVETLASYHPEQRKALILNLKNNHELHRRKVFERKKIQDKALKEQKKFAIQKKEDTAVLNVRKEKEGAGKLQALQQKWFTLVLVASRVAHITKTVDAARKLKRIALERRHAAVAIQRKYRDYRQKIRNEKVQKSLAIIKSPFLGYVYRRRLRLKHEAADVIRTFFKEVYDTSKLMKVVKKYSYAVLQAQKYSRDFLAVQRARAQIILKYTEKIEPLWRKKQSNKDLPSQLADFNRSNENISLNASRRASTKKSMLPTKKRKDDALDKIIYLISETVKRKVLSEDLVKRKKTHRAELLEYENKLIQYTAAQKKRLVVGKSDKTDGEDGLPKKPIFRLIPPQHHMFQLLDRAFALSSGASPVPPAP